jgi:hypothetical protein
MRVCVIGVLLFVLALPGIALAEAPDGLTRSSRDFLGFRLPLMGSRWGFRTGSVWAGVQAARSYIVYPRFGSHKGVPLQFQADYSFDNHWAAGVYGGLFQATYSDIYGSETYQSRLLSYSGGLRLTLHFSDVFNNVFGEVVNVRKWDFYSTAFAGWYSYRWKVDRLYEGQQDFSDGSFGSMGLVLGARWMPHPRLGIFAEAGKGPVGYLALGLSARVVK